MSPPLFFPLEQLTIQEGLSSTELIDSNSQSTWSINFNEHWAVLGGTENQRNTVLKQLKKNLSKPFAEVSLNEQQRWIQKELCKDDSDLTDTVFHGTPLFDLLLEKGCKANEITQLLAQFELSPLATTGFKYLSSGETRKTLIINALLQKPRVLILNNAFDGLDSQFKHLTEKIIDDYFAHKDLGSIILSSNRLDHLPKFITHLFFIDDSQYTKLSLDKELQTIKALLKTTAANHQSLPELPTALSQQIETPSSEILLTMKNITVNYIDKSLPCLRDINLTVKENEHWQVMGKNGSGKTTLLKLITGDHPQAFNNDIEVLGMRLGNGVSTWDIKKSLGHMSTEIFWSHQGYKSRIFGTALSTIISGLYDSIGLYQKPQTAEIKLGKEWLALIGLESKEKIAFAELSFCEQRLVLIARAMIKRPKLLLLDEPCSGLDSKQRHRVISLIQALIASKQTTLIYICHEDEESIAAITHQLVLS